MPAKRISADKARIAELEAELKSNRKKSKKLINEVSEFQEDVGKSIIPYQRLSAKVAAVIFFATGLGLLIYAATHPEIDDAVETRNVMYIMGGVLIAFSVVIYYGANYWYNAVEHSPSLQKLNATMFEINVAKSVFSDK